MNITIESVIKLHEEIETKKFILNNNLEKLKSLGFAKNFFWRDKYEFHFSWVLSKNKELLASIDGINGFTENDDYCTTNMGYIPANHPELIRWTVE